MGVVVLQILQWILRIILFLLLLIFTLIMIVLIVPIRYQAEGEFLEKKPGVRGKITWFFYLIYMTFVYEEDFQIQVRVFGFKVFDSAKEASGETKLKKKSGKKSENIVEEAVVKCEEAVVKCEEAVVKCEEAKDNLPEKRDSVISDYSENNDFEDISELNKEERVISGIQNENDNTSEKEKKSLSEKIEGIKLKIQEIIQKVKDTIAKIQEGKLKVEHYLELWNRKETQITFSRAKKKLGRMIKAVLPGKWKVTGELGFSDPCTTGQLMGVLGAMYPILGSKVQIVPNFETEVINIEGNVKGHIRLGNLIYQVISLILNRHCFKFIKLVLDELDSSKKSKEKQEN